MLTISNEGRDGTFLLCKVHSSENLPGEIPENNATANCWANSFVVGRAETTVNECVNTHLPCDDKRYHWSMFRGNVF